jgi:hypothetical protein
MVSSYNRDAPRPLIGTLWVWEPGKPHAIELIKVTAVRWNGEEWWVETEAVVQAPLSGEATPGARHWNDLSRFWEACHRVQRRPGPGGAPGVTRRGSPYPQELVMTR